MGYLGKGAPSWDFLLIRISEKKMISKKVRAKVDLDFKNELNSYSMFADEIREIFFINEEEMNSHLNSGLFELVWDYEEEEIKPIPVIPPADLTNEEPTENLEPPVGFTHSQYIPRFSTPKVITGTDDLTENEPESNQEDEPEVEHVLEEITDEDENRGGQRRSERSIGRVEYQTVLDRGREGSDQEATDIGLSSGGCGESDQEVG